MVLNPRPRRPDRAVDVIGARGLFIGAHRPDDRRDLGIAAAVLRQSARDREIACALTMQTAAGSGTGIFFLPSARVTWYHRLFALAQCRSRQPRRRRGAAWRTDNAHPPDGG